MTDQHLAISLAFDDRTPAEAYAAINDVASWWSGTVDGDPSAEGSSFIYNYGDAHHSVQRVDKLVPGELVQWHVTEANLPAVQPADEWAGTDIRFELAAREDGGTDLTFTHVGLTAACDCYGRCADGWSALIETNLRQRIATGQPQPDVFAAMA